MKEVDDMFTEERIENLMEEAKMSRKDVSYFGGYAGSYWEPPEPESLEIGFILTVEGLTAEEIKAAQELKEEPYFIQYCEMYCQELLKEKLYDDELSYWEINLHKDDIEVTTEGNKLSIDVYYYE